MFCNESAIRQQCLINRTHLVDAEIRIGNTSATAVLLAGGACQTHQVDDAKHTAVTELCIRNHLGIFRIKDMSFQRCNQKYIMQTVCICKPLHLILSFRIAVVDQLIELGKSFVQIVAVADLIHILADVVRDVAKRFQRISAVIALCLDGSIPKLRT